MGEKRGLELLRSIIDELDPNVECSELHSLFGDGEGGCLGRVCSSCQGEALRVALRQADEEMKGLKARLMPEGMELMLDTWPRFEDGEPVTPGCEFADGLGNKRTCTSVELLACEDGARHALIHWDEDDPDNALLVCRDSGDRVKRPAPKVLDADGVEIHVGDTVWDEHGDELVVLAVYGQDVHCRYAEYEDHICDNGAWEPSQLTHRAPVFAADGRPLRVGETVYYIGKDGPLAGEPRVIERLEKIAALTRVWLDKGGFCWPCMLTHRAPVLAADGLLLREGEHVYHVETGAELVVKELPKPGEYQAVVVFAPPASHLTSFDPDQLTHERPDSWERIEEDLGDEMAKQQCGPISPELACKLAGEFVRRCKALAEGGK